MTEKFIIGTKFYTIPKSGVPIIIRLKKQKGEVLYFNMGGYNTYLSHEEFEKTIKYDKLDDFKGSISIDENKVEYFYRVIDFFGTEVKQKWTVLEGDFNSKFIRFEIEDVFIKMNIRELKDNYIRLIPDAFFTISNASYKTVEDEINTDVMITVHKPGDKVPSLICRQDCADVFRVQAKGWQIPIGISIPRESCPKNINFLDFLRSDTCDNFKSVGIYYDDSLEAVLKYVGSLNRYNSTIKKLHMKYENSQFTGCCESVKELLEKTGFREDLKRVLGIFNYPFGVDLNRSEFNDAEIRMINKLIKPDHIKQIIEANYCPYDASIDLTKLNLPHMFVNIGNVNQSNLFIIAYREAE